MFNINKDLVRTRKEYLAKQREKIPFQTLMKWLDARQQPLKISDFIYEDRPNIIVDMKVTNGEEGDPSFLIKDLTDNGIKLFSASTLEEWNNGYSDYISYLKRGRFPVKLPIIRRDILLDNYQIVDSKLVLADGITLFPEFLDTKKIEELFNDAINLDFYIFPVISGKKDLKKIEKFDFDYIAVSYENFNKIKFSDEQLEKLIIFDIDSENIPNLFDKGIKYFWINWEDFDTDRNRWYQLIKDK